MKRALEASIVYTAMAIALIVLAVNASISRTNINRVSGNEAWVQHTQLVMLNIQTALADLTNAATGTRGYLLSGDESYLVPYRTLRDSALEHSAALINLVADNSPEQARARQLHQAVADAWTQLDAQVQARQTQANSATQAKLLADSKNSLDVVRDFSSQMQSAEQELLNQRQTFSEESLNHTFFTLVIASACAMAAVLGAFYMVLRDQKRRDRFKDEQNRLANYNRLLVESTGEGIYGVDLDGKCTFINKAGERLLGVRAADVIGKSMHAVTHHHKPDGSAYPVEDCPIYKSFKTGEGCRVDDELFFRSDGTSFAVEYSAFPIGKGRHTEGAVVTFQDITERKALQEREREAAERIRALADNIPQLAWMADGLGNLFWYNQRWFDYTGTTFDDMKGDGWKKMHDPTHVDRVVTKFAAAIQSGETWEDTFPLRRADGQYRWFLSRAIPIKDERGKITRWFGTNTDITNQREIEQELRESRESLRAARDEAEEARRSAEAANVAKSTFLANMSHELRTPLNAVIMYSELLQEEADDRKIEGFTADLDKIRGAGRHLLALVNGVLDLSKIEAGKMDLYLETFNVGAMVNDVATTVMPLVQKHNDTLKIDIGPDVGAMHADLTKVRQVLFNLLSNASKFTDKGVVELSARRELTGGQDMIVLSVRDSGIGMTPEQLGKLFQPFTQADASTTRKYGGTGLGLAISRRFCEMMGGSIIATSEPGKGSVFTAKLPARVAANEAAVETKPLPAAGQSTNAATTVLVIDDDSSVREVVTRALAPQEVRVLSAGDGETGLKIARDVKPDLIFLDVMMPKMDGWAVLTAIKAEPSLADTPVIMLTMVSQSDMGFMLGAAEYLTKPIDRDRLSSVFAKYRTQLTGHEVLIVEDDEATRQVIRRSLVRDGWDVTETGNGRAALDHAKEKTPTLVLLDLLMPEMDGFEFLAEFRKNPAWQTIPVVVLTSKDLTPAERNYLGGNVERILQKGAYSREDLMKEVRRIVDDCVVKSPDGKCLDATPAPPSAPMKVTQD